MLAAATAAVIGLAAGVTVALPGPGRAQAPVDGAQMWVIGGCASCHGNLAEGGQDPAMPQGPSIRRTRLDAAALKETIACGRADKFMPANLATSYTTTPCYGMALAAAPPTNIVMGAGYSAEELDALVTFLVDNVVGKTRITKANCALFNGGNADAADCRNYN